MTTLLLLLFTNILIVILNTRSTWSDIQWITLITDLILIQIFVISLHYLEYTRNRVQSGVLLFYWLIYLISSGIKIWSLFNRNELYDLKGNLYLINYFLVVTIFILENKRRPRKQDIELDDDADIYNIEENSNIFSRIVFHWLTPLLNRGYKRPLTQKDMCQLRSDNIPHLLSNEFQKNWEKELQYERPSLTRALYKTCGKQFVIGGVFKIIKDVLQYSQPLLMKELIIWAGSYLTEQPYPAYQGIMIAFAMFFSSVIQVLSFITNFHLTVLTGLKVDIILVTAIYRKALVLSNENRQGFTVGEIVNRMAVDSTKVSGVLEHLHNMWSCPLQVFLALFFLWKSMGQSIFAGVAVLVLSVPINILIAKSLRRQQKIQMKYQDDRIKLMNEILNGIKVIKLYAWEKPFMEKIQFIRNQLELKTLKKIGKLSAFQNTAWWSTPFLVTVVTLSVYINISSHPLTNDILFVSLSLFNMLQFPLTMFPEIFSNAIEAHVSLKRIEDYLKSEELDQQAVVREDYRNIPNWSPNIPLVDIQEGTFKWNSKSESPSLENINIQVKKGELVSIIGRVGSGKSSLISAILGDISKVHGTVHLRGSIAYCPQQPHIINATVRENILFGYEYDPVFYDKVIKACCLKEDLKIFPAGDQTEIGERGINLSGGQKARVSLARALYARADIYLLDDPLSAVDAHVGKRLFENVIGPNGLLKTKARILVTHVIGFMPFVDRIVILQDGKIVASETYNKLASSEAEFYSLLTNNQDNEHEVDTENESNSNIDESDSSNIKQHSRRPSNASILSTISSLLQPYNNGEQWGPSSCSNGTKKNIQNHNKYNLDEEEDNSITGNLITEEITAKGNVDLKVYKTYIESMSWLGILCAFSFQFVSQGLQVGGNYWLKHWASKNEQNEEIQQQWIYLSIYAIIGWSSTIFTILQSGILRIYCAVRSARLLHFGMLNNIFHCSMEFFDTTPLGRIINRFSRDQQAVDDILPKFFSVIFRIAPSLVATTFVISISYPFFIVIVIPLSFVYNRIQKYYLTSSRELRRLSSTARGPIFSHFQETISGVSTVRAYGQQQRFIYQNELRVTSYQQARYTSASCNRWLTIRLEFMGSLFIFSAAILSVINVLYQSYIADQVDVNDGSSFILNTLIKGVNKNIDPGLVGLTLTYALSLSSILTRVIKAYCQIETEIISVERIKEYSELSTEKYTGTIQSRKEWPENGKIEFNHYSTRYRKGLPLCIDDISFTINPSEKIGIVGRTGSGKSSLVSSLFRIIEATKGSIFVDDVPIAELGLTDLRSKISIIPQDPVLFIGTVRENLDPFGFHDDNALWSALTQAHLHDTIKKMDGQLDAKVVEGGQNISQGERQLVCLARSLLRKNKIIVLDEATSSVDFATDRCIQNTIRSEFADCTILTIAHRLNTIADYDRVIVLDQGKIMEFDTPYNLITKENGSFKEMCEKTGEYSKILAIATSKHNA
ncbi:unnamed protein product [Cunninghamella blakesleeana]